MANGWYLSSISIEELSELGFEIGDDRENEENLGKIQSKYLLSLLTKRQKRVALLLDDGYSRKEVASRLHICVQAVHQIVLRIRKRLSGKADGRDLIDLSRELILILNLAYPGLKAESVFRWWYKHPALKDYHRPPIKYIRKVMNEIYDECEESDDEDSRIEGLVKESEGNHPSRLSKTQESNSRAGNL
jgi:DNA-binding CsgD family transcriptional regulator